MKPGIEDVLDFWFGEQDDGFPVEDRNALWWEGGAENDAEVKRRFGGLLADAKAGRLREWEETPRGALALVIVLDQFSRMVDRGTAAAFACDEAARAVLERGLDAGVDRSLTWCERGFFYLPLEHAEDLAAQERCVALCEALRDEVPEHRRAVAQNGVDFAKSHLEIIARFGRFPHRNEVLGREATASEREYLAGGADRFGQ